MTIAFCNKQYQPNKGTFFLHGSKCLKLIKLQTQTVSCKTYSNTLRQTASNVIWQSFAGFQSSYEIYTMVLIPHLQATDKLKLWLSVSNE